MEKLAQSNGWQRSIRGWRPAGVLFRAYAFPRRTARTRQGEAASIYFSDDGDGFNLDGQVVPADIRDNADCRKMGYAELPDHAFVGFERLAVFAE